MRNLKNNFKTAGRLCLFIGATLTLQVLPVSLSYAQTASWYSTECCKFNKDPKCPTASGKSLYDLEAQNVYFAASWDYRLGTKVRVTNLENGKSIVVTIEDRGPAKRLYNRGRVIDLGILAFEALASKKEGIIEVQLGEV